MEQSPSPKRYCSVPDIWKYRTWFERHYGHLCKEHDEHYVKKDICMVCADVKLLAKVLLEILICLFTGVTAIALYPIWVFVALYVWLFK